jgi:RNA polymerase sigma factor (sigma-70 family)
VRVRQWPAGLREKLVPENKDIEKLSPSPASAARALEQYYPLLHRFLCRSLRGVHYQHARDLVQDIYLRFLALPHKDQVLHPQAYLLRIATNLITEYRLREQRAPVVFDSELADVCIEHQPGDVWKDAMGEGLQLRQQLEQELWQMPPTQRAVVLLWARDGLSPEEIAVTTGFTAKTTRKYLTRALAHLRESRRKTGDGT